MTALIVPSRFCGPPSSGNGGWTAGALAAVVAGRTPCATVEVTLRRPPPLDVPFEVVEADDAFTAAHDGVPVANARLVDGDVEPVPPVDPATAAAAEATYAGLAGHPFPTCFSCGTGREDGLRIFPGLVGTDPARVAATWTPAPDTVEDFHRYADDHPRASLPVTWAALDCVGAWAGDLEERLMVLGRMTATIDALPLIGEEHVVVGEARDQIGRKTFTASTLRDADGRIVGRAEHVWITVDPRDFA